MQFANKFSILCIVTIPVIALCFFIGLFSHGTGDLDLFYLLFGLIGVAVTALYSNLRSGQWAIPSNPVIFFVLLYWLVVWLSVFFSTFPFNSILMALIFSVLPFVFYTIALSAEPWEWLKRFGCGLGFGLLALALFALLQFFVLEPGERVHLPMRNPNNLSILFNMALFPVLAFYALAEDKKHIVLSLLGVFILLAALMVTQSRAGLLVFGVGIFAFFVVVRRISILSLKRVSGVALFFVLGFLIVNIISEAFLTNAFEKLVQVEDGAFTTRTISGRILVWQSTWALIQDHFWMGTGLGTFLYFYPRYRHPDDATAGYFAHMDPMQFWAEMGVFGTLAFYAMAISILWRTVLVGLRANKNNPLLVWMYACFFGLLILFLHTHLTFHLYIPVVLLVAGVLLAGWYLCSEALIDDQRKNFTVSGVFGRGLVVVPFAAVLLLTSVWMARAALGYYYVDIAVRSIQLKEFDEARAALDKASLYAPRSFSSYYQYEADYYLNLLQTAEDDREALYNAALSNINQAIAYNSGFVNLWNSKAQIYFTGMREFEPDGLEKAQVLLEDAVEADPYFFDARLGLTFVYREQGEDEKAKALMDEIEDLPRVKKYVERLRAAGRL